MLNKFLLVLSVVAALVFIRKRLLRYLRYLQQDEYSSQRFLVWYRERRAFDKRGTLIGMLVGLALCWSTQQWLVLSVVLVGILAFVIAAQREEDPRKAGKVRLVMTERARRIYQVAFGLLLALELATLYVLWQRELALVWLTFVVLVQLVPFGLLAAVRLLAPGERMRQVAFITEAEETLSSVATTVIGVTGSYGKTSVKNMLGEVLSTSLAATFWPKAGINTLMGNVRAVRNGLHAGYRYAVIEMGAYRTGSIAEQCALVRPTVGIITAIGEMHLERFGSVDNIYRAKTELADALPQTGILICNGDNAGARKAASEFERETTLLYGFDNTHEDLDCWVKSISFDESGSRFTLNWRGADYELQSKLLGRPAIHNLAGVFAAACVLGADPLMVSAAIANIEPVSNRLAVEKRGDLTFLQDAYNSNPIGFRAALEVLHALPAKRRILITPGMVELGDRQFDENRSAATEASKVCDVVAVVGETNRRALCEGLSEGGLNGDAVLTFATRERAFNQLESQYRAGDVILIENDLTDWYEDRTTF